ncbi:hypothetical protein JB92DRAFT_2827609 [Gautieria morchelliformis]|nr:hypothetical protein JB92DRAFT_2827609 [Gautieria morchelliformis]
MFNLKGSRSSIDQPGPAASKFLTSEVWSLIRTADSTTVILLAASRPGYARVVAVTDEKQGQPPGPQFSLGRCYFFSDADSYSNATPVPPGEPFVPAWANMSSQRAWLHWMPEEWLAENPPPSKQPSADTTTMTKAEVKTQVVLRNVRNIDFPCGKLDLQGSSKN